MRMRYFAVVIAFCIFLTFTSIQNVGAEPSELNFDHIHSGPYVDELVYEIISGESNRVQALLDDELDIIGGPISEGNYATLDAASDIEVSSVLRNGYGKIVMNCRNAPLNWTDLRRAFAYAYNKTAVKSEVFGGRSRLHDSLVPYANTFFCIEDELPYHYYTSEITIGNQLLNDSGFDIDPVTGYRNDPNGNPIHIEIAYSAFASTDTGSCAQVGVDALRALHIDAETNAEDFYILLDNMYNHGDYSMIVHGSDFDNYEVDWLAHQYWSGSVSEYGMNLPNFVNSTYDLYRDQLLNGVSYEEVYNAAREMQKILHYNVPVLVVYENYQNAGYRTDRFSGHVVDVIKNVGNEWTNLKAHLGLIDGGPFSGTLRIGMWNEPNSFNPMTTGSPYSKMIFDNVFSTLLRTGPDGHRKLDLATAYTVETHTDNPEVPLGHTRLTFNIVQNATWSDGTPLTAEDIAYTIYYYYETTVYGNPTGLGLTDLVGAYATHPRTLVVEFGTESYWHLSKLTDMIILQKSLLQSIGLSGWNSWNPVFSDPFPTSGPFNLTHYSVGTSVELSCHPGYHYRVRGTGSGSPEISSPEDTLLVEGMSINTISWTVSDDDPLVYRIFHNDSIILAGYYETSTIELELEAYVSAYGTYNFTLEVRDWEYQRAVDTVLVEYVPDTFAPEISGPDDFEILDIHSGETIITWMVFDHNIANYTFYCNGEYAGGGTWATDPEPTIHPIPKFLGDLTEGVYNFTILVRDDYGNNAADTVLVTIVSDTLPPELTGPDDIEMLVGDLDLNIQWNASDSHPDHYEIYMDDILNTSGDWESDVPIVFNLDGFEAGVFNVTIYVMDLSGNIAADSVIVIVRAHGLEPMQMMLIGLGGVAVVVIIAGILIKRKT